MARQFKLNQLLVLAAALCCSLPALADPAAPLSALAQMPVRELTVFKNGYALVLHKGKMATDTNGNVQMDYLPTPVLGTFWPSSNEKDAGLSAVVSSRHKVLVSQTALSIPELLEANPRAEIRVTELKGTGLAATTETYDATIAGVPTRSAEELERNSPPNSGEKLPQKANLVMLKTQEGLKTVPFERIQAVSFKGNYETRLSNEEFRNLLTLNLDWGNRSPGKSVDVGIMYLQQGLSWSPSYKLTLDSAGHATAKLEATLDNQLADLEDVTANLVIGVPHVAFAGIVDPIAMQQVISEIGEITTEVQGKMIVDADAAKAPVGMGAAVPASLPPPPPAPSSVALFGSSGNEDLYVFTVKHLTVKKGQRICVPIAECALNYRDVYTLDIPFAPPAEVCNDLSLDERNEIAKQVRDPKALHKLRITNHSAYPLTVAPVLISNDAGLLGQSRMQYTAIGAETDIDLTTAVDVKVKKTDNETKRIANAVTWNHEQYTQVDLSGLLSLTNYSKRAVDLEITRRVLGQAGIADHQGLSQMVNVFEDPSEPENPDWWGQCSWPDWWGHFNGVGRFTWKLTLEPQQNVKLGYKWHYFWN